MGEKTPSGSQPSNVVWDNLEEWVRRKVQEFIQSLLEEEIAELLGRQKSERRRVVDDSPAYRNGYGNVTDPDSRIMKARQGYVQGYNVQAIVSRDQIIVATGVTQEANDVQQLKPMLETLEHTLEAAGIEDGPQAALADAGYWSEANLTACSGPEGPELLIATTKDWKQRKAARERGCPEGASPET